MSLDVTLYMDVDTGGKDLYRVELFEANITHNLNEMAQAVGIYKYLWRPEEVNCIIAKDIIDELSSGLKELKEFPTKYKQYDADNGWGVYDGFVLWLEKYLNACKKHPKAIIEVWR